MDTSLLYLFFAIFTLGFVVFIHELGHYFMARRVGMRVEAFGIGFGRPIFSWEHDGVQWNIGWLPFGGYVKMAGMEKEGDVEPSDIPDGFFGKSPWDRIKVAFMGPLVNLVFAFLLFVLLWGTGGWNKPYREVTQRAGWVDPKSELYAKGIRSGDLITSYNDEPVTKWSDHIAAAMFNEGEVTVKGYRFNDQTGERVEFSENVKPYSSSADPEDEMRTLGISQPAGYLIYDRLPNKKENPLPELSPLKNSGIEYGDRIVWIDGHSIFSVQHIADIVTEERALLTVRRGNQEFLARVPRTEVGNLKVDSDVREEIIDWQFASELRGQSVEKLYYIPYNISSDLVVENRIAFIEKEAESAAFPAVADSALEEPLQAGDRILAIDGVLVNRAHKAFKELQTRRVHVIVARGEHANGKIPWTEADKHFEENVSWANLDKIAATIGRKQLTTEADSLHLLKPVTPVARKALYAPDSEEAKQFNTFFEEQTERAKEIENTAVRDQFLAQLDEYRNRVFLGIDLQDHQFAYNPGPIQSFVDVWNQVVGTLKGLFQQRISPKYLVGPVGIVQVVQTQWTQSVQDALFWIAVISLNLGMINLLPIPVLDGGHILMAIWEMISGKPLKAKTMERLIFPFAVLIIGFFIYITYHDVGRLMSQWF